MLSQHEQFDAFRKIKLKQQLSFLERMQESWNNGIVDTLRFRTNWSQTTYKTASKN